MAPARALRCRQKGRLPHACHAQLPSKPPQAAARRRRPGFAPLVAGSAFLLDAAAAVAQEAAQYTGPVDSSTYVPGPVDVGWQIYFGAAIGVFPFIIGSYEFGKRILIQRRCETCNGIGLITMKNGRYAKCKECGGFFPWLGWKTFFTSTASPGNGGPLLQPRGQTSVFYKVPAKKEAGQCVASDETAGKAPLAAKPREDSD